MFSNRATWDRTLNRMASVLEDKRRSRVTLLDLTESNPTAVGLPGAASLLAPLGEPAALRYEPVPQGLSLAREAVSVD